MSALEQRRVAIKMLHANLAGNPLRRERFIRGAQAMKKRSLPIWSSLRVHVKQRSAYCFSLAGSVPSWPSQPNRERVQISRSGRSWSRW